MRRRLAPEKPEERVAFLSAPSRCRLPLEYSRGIFLIGFGAAFSFVAASRFRWEEALTKR